MQEPIRCGPYGACAPPGQVGPGVLAPHASVWRQLGIFSAIEECGGHAGRHVRADGRGAPRGEYARDGRLPELQGAPGAAAREQLVAASRARRGACAAACLRQPVQGGQGERALRAFEHILS